MTNMQIFNNEQFGQIRTVIQDDKVLFCASDIAKALGYSNPNKAINNHCKAITKRYTPLAGKMQETIIINESGLYSLILSSKLPKRYF